MLISGMEQYLHFRLPCPPFYFAIEWGVLILWQTKSHICSWRTQAHYFPGSRTEAPMAASKLPHGHTPQDLCTLTLVQV